MLERLLGGSHRRLRTGITDITLKNTHVEIKRWERWSDAVGQLAKYQHAEPKQELRVYLFGKFSGSNKQVALDVFWSRGIRVYDMIHQGPIVEIYELTATGSTLQACIA